MLRGDNICGSIFEQLSKIQFDISSKMPILDLENIRCRIREILKSGAVEYTLHCRQRMYLRGIQMDDILFLLNWGRVEPGQQDGDNEGQVFRITGADVEEVPLTAVVKIIDDQRIRCITVF